MTVVLPGSRWRLVPPVAALPLVAALLLSCGGGEDETRAAPPATGRVLLLGLDGADWERIDPLIEAGRLPHFEKLRREGATGILLSEDPMLSPILWTSIATGRGPDVHGVLSFLTKDSRGRRIPVTSRQVRVPSLWHVLSKQGKSAGVIGWYATWPADTIRGYVVSDRVGGRQVSGDGDAPAAGLVSPPALIEVVREEAGRLTFEARQDLFPLLNLEARQESGEDPVVIDTGLLDSFARLHGAARLHVSLARRLWRERPTDLLAVYLEVPDGIYHLFSEYEPPRRPGVDDESFERYRDVCERYLVVLDGVLGELLSLLGEGDSMVLVSDHGFRQGESRPPGTARPGTGHAPEWHRKEGVLALFGAAAEPGLRVEPARLQDVVPTLLHVLGLPVAEDLEGRVLVEALSSPLRARQSRRIATFGPREIEEGDLPEDPGAGDRIELLRRLGYLGGEDETARDETSTQTLQEAYNRGFALLFSGDLDGAEAAFRRLESLAPGTGLSDLGLGEVALRRGDVPAARDRFEAAVRARPGDPVARLDLGLARLSLGDLEGAENDLRAVLAQDDRRFLALRGMGEIELRRDRPVLALEHLERASKVAASEPRRADAEYLRGTALLRLGRTSEAVERFRETLVHRPDHPEALFRVAQFALEGGRPDEAASALERLVALRPDDADLRRLWSQALLEAGREEEARAVLTGRTSPGS